MVRNLVVTVGSLAVGATAAILVGRHLLARPPLLPQGWAEVTVLGRGDEPIPGVTLRWGDDPAVAETDARGVALIDLRGHGDDPAVEFGGTLTNADWDEATDSVRYRIRTPRSVARLRNAIPCDVTFFDARDGRPLPGGRAGWAGEPTRAPIDASDATIRGLFNNNCSTWFELDAPPGFAFADGRLRVESTTASFVRRYRVTVPVWPAGLIHCRVLDADGRPVAGPLSSSVALGISDEPWTSVVADADGRFELVSVPLVPSTVAHVRVQSGKARARADFEVVAGKSEFHASLTLSNTSEPGRCGGSFYFVSYDELPPGGDSTLRLRVLRNDGTPARRTRVLLRGVASPRDFPETGDFPEKGDWECSVETDDDGRASRSDLNMERENGLEHRSLTVVLAESGFVLTAKNVPLAPGGTAECELREADGEEIALTILDADDRPVPWARVSAGTQGVYAWDWCPVTDGVSDATPRTGPDGKIVLRGLPEGSVGVTAESCGKSVTQQLRIGLPATIRLNL